jgi:predicted dehydrogenase
MPIRVGFLSVAHMHAWGYAPAFAKHRQSELVGLWDDDPERRAKFAAHFGVREFETPDALAQAVDAVVICSENKKHADWIELAAAHSKPALCEKPLCTTLEEANRIRNAGGKVMTAFPCRYSPAFLNLKAKVQSGDLGQVKGICATNRGRCPWGWFTDVSMSGGGAMIDHVVHVTDLLRVLLNSEVVKVQAQTGNNMYGQEWDDTAMLTLEFANGVFATLDSSWSRHKSYKTWGDVTMNVVGDQGVIELEMFGQALDTWMDGPTTHNLSGFGSDLDAGLVDDFLRCVIQDVQPPITAEDGIRASEVAIAGYESARRREAVELS